MTTTHPLRVVLLGSGSSGNATAITDGVTTVLLDCGFSAKEVGARLDRAGIAPSSVAALLVTHEHSDHTRGVDVFVRRYAPGCTIVASAGTARAANLGAVSAVSTARCCEPQRIGTLEITPFAVSHDAAEPLGYRIDAACGSVGIATDTGVLTAQALEVLRGVELLGIESNHDVRMLERGPYPGFLKRRILSHTGHLSNEAAAAALGHLASESLSRVFALHRSTTNNTAALAEASLLRQTAALGISAPVTVVSQTELCDSSPPQSTLFEAAGR